MTSFKTSWPAVWRPSAKRAACRQVRHHQQSHRSPLVHAARPSLNASAATISAARGSIHHQPNTALAASPSSTTAERYVHSCVSAASALSATEPIRPATRRLAQASDGMTISDSAVITSPSGLRWGSSRTPSKVLAASVTTYTEIAKKLTAIRRTAPLGALVGRMVETQMRQPPDDDQRAGHVDHRVETEPTSAMDPARTPLPIETAASRVFQPTVSALSHQANWRSRAAPLTGCWRQAHGPLQAQVTEGADVPLSVWTSMIGITRRPHPFLVGCSSRRAPR